MPISKSLLLTVASFATLSANAQEKSPPAPIPIVKTWEELQTLPAIDVGGGVKIRVGLEAAKIPQWSGGLIYCLTEGYKPDSGGSGPDAFGPVHVSINFADEQNRKEVSRWARSMKDWAKGSYLYVRAGAADRIGTYKIRVTHRDGKLLAQTSYDGTKDFFHPWMPWLEGLYKPTAPKEGIVLPVAHDLEVAFVESGKPKKGKLPTLLPPDDQPALAINKEGNEIVIRAKTEFTTSRPDYHFLARWWVNDKPFVPKQTEQFWLFNGYGLVSQNKELRVQFKFHPERLGAKPGDRIGLQLMHCESQWEWCRRGALDNLRASKQLEGENVRVSNRIQFTAKKE